MKIIFDYNRTLFNPETSSLYEGVLELLESLAKDKELFLVSRGSPDRQNVLAALGIDKYFSKVAFVESKTTDVFRDLVEDGTNVVVIGDRVKGEIALGNQIGAITIWIRQGKFAQELPEGENEEPNYTIETITDVETIIRKYER